MSRNPEDFGRATVRAAGGSRRTWSTPLAWTAVVAGIGVHALFFFAIRVDLPERSMVPHARAFVQYSGGGSDARDQLFREQALLFDSAPLFIPSPWNAAGAMRNPVRYPERRLFGDFTAVIELSGESMDRLAPGLSASREAEPEDTVAGPYWHVFAEFGRDAPPDREGPAAAGAVIEIFELGSARVVRREVLPQEVFERSGEALWAPAEFQLHVEGGRVAGEPIQTRSTGISEFDAALREHLRTPFLGAGLDRGYYRITVSP